jgi:hypothetical protein
MAGRAGVDFFRSAGGFGGELFPAGGLAALLAAVGAVYLWRDGRRAELLSLLGVAGVALLASALHKYPFSGRLLLFLAPPGVLLVAAGTAAVAGAVWERSRVAGGLIAAVVVLGPTAEVYRQFRHPDRAEQLPTALGFIRERWQSGDQVYVFNGRTDVSAGPVFAFYDRRDPFPPEAVVLVGVHRDDPRGYQAVVKTIASAPGRVRVLFSHQHLVEEAWVRAYFDAIGDRGEYYRDADTVRGPRTAVYLYTIR